MSGPILGSYTGLILTAAAGITVAEFVGYVLHRAMHSERFPNLSRAHMIHHFHLYGPQQQMRTPFYKDATEGRAALGNIGMEWILPSAAVLVLCWLGMWAAGVPWPFQALGMAVLVGWPLFMFSYLHDRMHLENFWMERAPLVRAWFTRARRLHDIHHHAMNDEGRMTRNFGIGFFFFDRLFRTFIGRHCPLNRRGYRAACERYRLEGTGEDVFAHFPSSYRV